MIKLIFPRFYQFFLTSVGIFFVGALPYLFYDVDKQITVLKMVNSGEIEHTRFLGDQILIRYDNYFSHVFGTVKHFLNIVDIGDMTYYIGVTMPLFPEFIDRYIVSMKYLVSALIVSLIMAVLVTYLVMLFSPVVRRKFKFVLFILESLPDIFVILVLQLCVIWLYKASGVRLFNIVDSYGEPAYALPILTLSILPTVYIVKYLLLAFEEENDMIYVELAKGKGLNRSYILLIHIFRNAVISLLNQFKPIFWFALSNLLMLEIIFNIYGFTSFLWRNAVLNPEVFTLGLFMVFMPFFLIFTLGDFMVKRINSLKG